MNRILSLVAIALVIAPAGAALGQVPDAPAGQQPGRPRHRDRIDRVERLKQMRLIEELNLSEEEAVRFMSKRKEHEDRMAALAAERNAMLDDLAAALDGGSGGKAGEAPAGKDGGRTRGRERSPAAAASVEKTVAGVLEHDRKIFDERRRYQEEMRSMLPPERFAKMLVFERDFQMQVRDAMGRSMKRRASKFDD